MVLDSQLFMFMFLPLFFTIFFIVHHIFKNKADDLLLIVGSLIFYYYGGLPSFIYLIALSFLLYLYHLLFPYVKKIKIITILVVLIFLIYVKYYNFIFNTKQEIMSVLAISFLSFSAISFIVDVSNDYKRYSFKYLLLYLSLFPKILAGPIVLFKDFNKAYLKREITLTKITEGITRFIIGYAKKTIIANTLGVGVLAVYNNLSVGVDHLSLYLMILAYAMQLYFDFMGYSDMAIGLLSIFGFEVKENFNHPYQAKSLSEFWRRWHISLGNWFFEYVYLPLGGSLKGVLFINVMVVFALTGIWHGAAFKYILWGLAHGLFIYIEKIVDKTNKVLIKKILKIITPLFILLAWIPFSAPSLKVALTVFKQLFSFKMVDVYYKWSYYFDKRSLIFLVFALVYSYFNLKINVKIPLLLKYLLLIILFVIAISFSINTEYSPFIYARY